LKISELVSKLEAAKSQVGDLEVTHWDDWIDRAVQEVNIVCEHVTFTNPDHDYLNNQFVRLGRPMSGYGQSIDTLECY
jgi:hypothetical protein